MVCTAGFSGWGDGIVASGEDAFDEHARRLPPSASVRREVRIACAHVFQRRKVSPKLSLSVDNFVPKPRARRGVYT
jgi:hypothetical protein